MATTKTTHSAVLGQRFTDDVVIITGAAGEMAQRMTRTIIQEGGTVIGIELNQERLDVLEASLEKAAVRTGFKGIVADLTDKSAMAACVAECSKEFHKIDILINHACCTVCETLAETTPEDWDKELKDNLNSTYYITYAVLKAMEQAQKGVIVSIGSINADAALGNPAYSAAKAALVSYTKAIAMEYGAFNIRANVVSPGSVLTRSWDHRIKKDPKLLTDLKKWYPLHRLATPEDVAEAVLFLASPQAKSISGVNLRVDAGLGAGTPLFASAVTRKPFNLDHSS